MFDNLGIMARSHDREIRDARSAFLGAVIRLNRAMNAFDANPVNLEPGPAAADTEWTREQAQIMMACAAAWRELVDRRRAYDAMRREWQPPH